MCNREWACGCFTPYHRIVEDLPHVWVEAAGVVIGGGDEAPKLVSVGHKHEHPLHTDTPQQLSNSPFTLSNSYDCMHPNQQHLLTHTGMQWLDTPGQMKPHLFVCFFLIFHDKQLSPTTLLGNTVDIEMKTLDADAISWTSWEQYHKKNEANVPDCQTFAYNSINTFLRDWLQICDCGLVLSCSAMQNLAPAGQALRVGMVTLCAWHMAVTQTAQRLKSVIRF